MAVNSPASTHLLIVFGAPTLVKRGPARQLPQRFSGDGVAVQGKGGQRGAAREDLAWHVTQPAAHQSKVRLHEWPAVQYC
jgi:hypothetical protein